MGRLSDLLKGKQTFKPFGVEETVVKGTLQSKADEAIRGITPSSGKLSSVLRQKPETTGTTSAIRPSKFIAPNFNIPTTRVGTRDTQRLDRQSVGRDRAEASKLKSIEITEKEEQRKQSLTGGELRLTNLLKQAKDIETSIEPDFEKQRDLTKDILETRNVITANQPGFKTGLRESVGLEPTAQFSTQLATPERAEAKQLATQEAQQQKGFTGGRVVGELGKQAALYATVGNALKGTQFFKNLGTKLGGGKVATFAADQVADLFVDAVIQTPQEVLRGDTIKTIGMNRLLDIGINLVIGGSVDGVKYLKSLENADPVAFKQVANQLQPQELKVVTDATDSTKGIDTIKGVDAQPAKITDDLSTVVDKPVSKTPLTDSLRQQDKTIGAEIEGLDDSFSTTLKLDDGIVLEQNEKLRRTIHNSLKKSNMPEEVKAYFDNNPEIYEVLSNQKTWDNAFAAVNNDFDGVLKKFNEKGALESAEDSAEAIAIMHKMANDGDIEAVKEFSKTLAEKGTEAGQTVQALSLLSKTTPEGRLLQAQKDLGQVGRDIKENSKELFDTFKKESSVVETDVKKSIDDVVKDVNTNIKKDLKTKDILEKLTPEQMLANKINKSLKEVKAKDRDLIQEMVDGLFAKTNKKLGIPELPLVDKSAKRLVDSVAQRQEYARVWQASKEILKKELPEDLFKQIDEYIQTGVRPTFNESTLNRLINESIKTNELTIADIVKKGSKGQLADRRLIKQTLLDRLGLKDSDAEYLSTFIDKNLKDSIKAKRELLLAQHFPEVSAKNVKAPFKKLQDIVNLGGLENTKYKSRIAEKLPAEIKSIFKESNIKLDEIVQLGKKDQSSYQKAIVSDIMARLDIDDKYYDQFKKASTDAFNELSDKAKAKIQKQMLKVIPESTPKPVRERIENLYNLDALNDLTKEKYGLPTLSTKETEYIMTQMEKAQGLTGRPKEILLGRIDQMIIDKIPATFKEKFMAVRNISLLGQPKTIVTRNPLSNIVFGGIENVAQIPSGITNTMLNKVIGTPKTIKTLPPLLTQAKGFKKGLGETLEDIKFGIDTSVTRGGAELPRSRKVFDKSLATTLNELAGNPVKLHRFLEISWLNKANNWLGDTLKLGDRPFYQAAYEGRLKELKDLNPNMTKEEMEAFAKEFGKDRVFQNDGETAKIFSGIKKSINKANVADIGIADFALPYTQTTGNILEKGIEYTPLNLINIFGKIGASGAGQVGKKLQIPSLIKASSKGVGANPEAFSRAVGRTFTGTGIIALGYKLRKEGYISGEDKSKGKERDLNKQAGNRGYSIKIGDTWYSYDWAQPVSVPLAIGADAYEAGLTEDEFIKKVEGGITAGAGTVFDQSLFRGITNLFGGQFGTPAEGILNTLTKNAPTQFLSTAGSQIAQFSDEFKRDIDWDNLGDLAKRKVVGLRETLPIMLDMFGEPVLEQDGRKGIEKAIDVFLNPSLKTKISDDPVIIEISRLFNTTDDSDVIPSKMPSGLTKEQEREFKLVYGKEIKKKLVSLQNSIKYKSATDEVKAKQTSKEINDLYREVKDDFGY